MNCQRPRRVYFVTSLCPWFIALVCEAISRMPSTVLQNLPLRVVLGSISEDVYDIGHPCSLNIRTPKVRWWEEMYLLFLFLPPQFLQPPMLGQHTLHLHLHGGLVNLLHSLSCPHIPPADDLCLPTPEAILSAMEKLSQSSQGTLEAYTQ